MEGFSKIAYKGKEILYADYSSFGFDKEKTLQLISGFANEYMKCPPKSALALVNVANLHFDTDIINALKENQDKTVPYQKKVAIIGMKGLQKVAYNFIITLTQRDSVKILNSENEAKEWLVSD
ncbi:MAG: hypothetical protein GXY86_04405 [Firmicutes bacterium]|nr:hypothetical protein [Bacillota bacterium]